MPEMPEVQAHAERLSEHFGGLRLKQFRPFTFTALKTAVPAPEQAYGESLRRRRPARQVPPARVRAGDVRRPSDAGRPPRRRREEVGQAACRPSPLRLRASARGHRSTSAAAHRTGLGAQGRRLVRADREGVVDRAARHARAGGRLDHRCRVVGAFRRAGEHPAALVPPRPARHRRPRPQARQRGVLIARSCRRSR